MASMMGYFKTIVMVQLFFAFGITLLTYALPAVAQDYVTSYSDLANTISLDQTAVDVQNSLESQTNIPVLDVGALVFYSGNIILDLLLNFAFAVPEMINIFLNSFIRLFNIDSFVWASVQLFITVIITILYYVGLMQLITGVRSGRVI